ncbi:CynX/NimT family MFS transporter [Thermodesulfobacteriota bacterium]
MAQERVSLRAWAVLGCAWVLCFAMFSRVLCLPPIGNIVKDALFLSHSKVGLIFSLPVAILAVTSIASGILGDRIGARRWAGIGAIVMALGSFLTGAATGFWSLFWFTCIFGIGLSMTFTNLPKLMGIWFPPEKVGMATGIYVTGVAIGASVALAITLSVIYPLTDSFRGTFYIWSFPLAFGAVLWWLVVKERPSIPSDTQGEEASGRTKPSYSVWKNRSLWLLAFVICFQNIQFYTWTGWTPQLMRMKGASPEVAALMVSVMSGVSIPCMFLIPWAAHRVGLVKPFIWLAPVGLIIAAWAAVYIPLSLAWPLMIFLGIVLASFPLLLALPVDLVPEECVGTATGMVLSIGYVGALVGPWLAGYLLDVTGSLNPALVVLMVAGIVHTAFGMLLPETGSRSPAQRT